MDYLFVYGTLRSDMGHPMHEVLERYAQFVGVGTILGKLFNLGHYPGLVLAKSKDTEPSLDTEPRVWGEVYALNAETTPLLFEMLDDYESYDPEQIRQSEYCRETVPVQLADNPNAIEPKQHSVVAWTYVYNQDIGAYPVIPSGNYADTVATKSPS